MILIAVSSKIFGQLPNGSDANDFTVQDINGGTYSLFSKMGANKSACLDFSATWCAPCWSFHQSGVLEQVNNNLSAYTTVIFLESDWNTNTNCLYGPSGCNNVTQGNWVAGTPYPIADLSSSNGAGVNNDYNIAYYPTLYVISPDKRVWEIMVRTYQNYVNWITGSFTLAATANLTNSTCGDNGKIILNPTGGFSTLSYKWSNGETTKDLNNIPGGTYSVTITDVNGYFKSFGPYVITGPQKRVDVTNVNLTHIKCFDEATGSISIQADYGTPPYTYSWSNGFTSSSIDNLKAGIYSITITDSKGCTRMKSYTLSQPADLKITATSGKENCSNQDGFIQVKGQGGVSPYKYDLGSGIQTSPYFAKLKGGKDYTVTITDANACTESVTIFVDITERPKADAGSDKSLDCKKDTISLDGTQSDQGSPFVYSWTTSDGIIVKDAETLLPQVIKPGKYYLKVTNIDNKCVNNDSVLVIDKRIYPDISATGDTTLNCNLTETELSGNSTNSNSKFYWKKIKDSLFVFNGKKLIVSDSGQYVFQVVDTINLCISKDTIRILTDQNKPQAVAVPEKEVSCKNTEVVIDGSASSQGIEFTYHWVTSNGNIVTGDSTLKPLVNKGGEYILEVTNTKNYCKSKASVSVLQQTSPVAAFTQFINGLSAKFNDLSQGIPSSWQWMFGDGTKSSEKNPEHEFPSDGEYEVCLSIQNDCGQDVKCQKILVGISAALDLASSDIHPVSCFGGNDGSITLTVQGGVPPYKYNWSNQETSKDISGLVAGDYTVEIKDQQGTLLIKSFKIDEAQEIELRNATIVNTSSGKNEGSILLDISGGVPQYKFLWSNGMTSNPAIDLGAGDYTCELSDSNNCVKIFGPFTIKEITATNHSDGVNYLEIMPNPASGKGMIHVHSAKLNNFTLNMLNAFGEIVWTKVTSDEFIPMDFNNYARGLYFVMLGDDRSRVVLKWIIE